MTRSILASIIVPVYNVEPYIDQCLRSVLSQTICNIEIIVVDDCSTDNSAKVVKKYCKIDNRIIFLQHDKNKGLSNTRNTGLSYAKGEFIFFVDSDDYVDNNYCARLIYAIEKEQADVACCNVVKVYDNAVISPYKVRNENAPFPSLITPHVMNSIMSVVWNKVYKRQIINKEKIKFTPNINNEDELWWREYCLLSSRVAWVDGDALYFYRCRQASLMRKMTNFERSYNMFEISKRYLAFAKKSKREDFIRDSYTLYFSSSIQYDSVLDDAAGRVVESELANFIKNNGLSPQSFSNPFLIEKATTFLRDGWKTRLILKGLIEVKRRLSSTVINAFGIPQFVKISYSARKVRVLLFGKVTLYSKFIDECGAVKYRFFGIVV